MDSDAHQMFQMKNWRVQVEVVFLSLNVIRLRGTATKLRNMNFKSFFFASDT